MNARVYHFSAGHGLPLKICSVRLIQRGDVFEEASPSVEHELERKV